MVSGGDIDRNMLLESFSRIKEDIARLNSELYELKLEHKKVLEENIELKKANNNTGMNKEDISAIVQETLKHIKEEKKDKFSDALVKKINKKRKEILKHRIQALAEQKNLSLPDIKDIIVDQESLCSKATFYRYTEKLKKNGVIDFLKINDKEIVVKI